MLVLGYHAATEQFGPQELLDLVVEAERCGFDSIMASDHFHPWRADDVECFDVWSWLGAVGTKTQKVQFGTGVTAPTLRYNPAVIAQAAATLGELFPGRFWLGLGAGEAINEESTTGCWPQPPERFRRLAEATEIIRRLFDGEYLTYRGQYFQTRDAHLYLTPSKPIPLFIGTYGPSTARLLGKYADGWLTTGPRSGPPVDQNRILDAIAAGARSAQRDPAAIARAVEVKVVYAKDRATGIREARWWNGNLVPDRDKFGIYDPRALQRFGDRITDEEIEKFWFISGDPDEHVAHAQRFIQAGFTQLFFHTPGSNQREFLDVYGQHVLPALRRAWGSTGAGRPLAA
jgi:coenzyme F420-dependent glucose-6-phosphate dehydrogenase